MNMPTKMLFLSHIHEEQPLALLIKNALEFEFGGFVDVFVSSDGTSIPAGSNFLRRIEDGLVNCIGAIYLISPFSVSRNWINFELGAVWIRNATSIRNGSPEIPTLPICHSGTKPSSLPSPLNNLNAIVGNDPRGLEFAFTSLQTAVGGKGKLKSSFVELSNNVKDFERFYDTGRNLKKVLSLGRLDMPKLIEDCKKALDANKDIIEVRCGDLMDTSHFLNAELTSKGLVHFLVNNRRQLQGPAGYFELAEVSVLVSPSLVLEHLAILLA